MESFEREFCCIRVSLLLQCVQWAEKLLNFGHFRWHRWPASHTAAIFSYFCNIFRVSLVFLIFLPFCCKMIGCQDVFSTFFRIDSCKFGDNWTSRSSTVDGAFTVLPHCRGFNGTEIRENVKLSPQKYFFKNAKRIGRSKKLWDREIKNYHKNCVHLHKHFNWPSTTLVYLSLLINLTPHPTHSVFCTVGEHENIVRKSKMHNNMLITWKVGHGKEKLTNKSIIKHNLSVWQLELPLFLLELNVKTFTGSSRVVRVLEGVGAWRKISRKP